jgi:hypothetical protein
LEVKSYISNYRSGTEIIDGKGRAIYNGTEIIDGKGRATIHNGAEIID